ncbi:PREDICTED: origin recognition complex subunit 2 [Trachymyrmex cornetzi]|uniref:origin recognition complex subunit 2 n=1 Tax=Trachymyrmex cornetzi TaxID=471704 RepID=UPI00084F22BA|nr:PREDICTED: origin recognition complex subunit 2 [Trachymyrmex cornetzi]XP_018371241.1 PREDICTED: origin recognition complex subunit 2 [Trachymyrmex cornetzi]XP_018371242.1 PREDICTED: origin recognition complex subunit 2 [Trachymyrmex cornetzi]
MASARNVRRSTRIKPHVKYTEVSDEETPVSSPQTNILNAEIEEQLKDIKEDVQKPLELFSEKDVSGRKLYGFQTPTKRNSMMIKANQCRTPETPKSFKTLPILKIVLNKIITNPDDEMVKKDSKVSRKRYLPSVTSSGNESMSEDSEYIPSNNEVSSESYETSDKSEDSDNSDVSQENNIRRKVIQKVKPLLKREVQNTPTKSRRGRKTVAYKDYHIQTDEYFETQSGKIVTSDRTLERLKNACLTEESLGKLLINQSHISKIHKKRIYSLTENCTSFFPMWQFILEEGYSLLLHGVGSKRNLINDFYNEIIEDHPTLVINGFFPSLTLKDILDNIIMDLLDLNCPTNLNDCLELIETVMGDNPDDRLYLLIHNIDGVMLRSNKAQNILASLAAIPNIHVLASVDHINAPILWDHVKRAKFNFYWWDATTLLPYQAETSYESSLLVQQSSGLVLSSLQNVFLSLTSNARAIYLILVEYQLSNNSSNFTGMAFRDLYRAAREQFLVSSDLTLRAQLTEFIDHKLLRIKRTVDGVEHLTIPLDNSLLKQFMEQHGS